MLIFYASPKFPFYFVITVVILKISLVRRSSSSPRRSPVRSPRPGQLREKPKNNYNLHHGRPGRHPPEASLSLTGTARRPPQWQEGASVANWGQGPVAGGRVWPVSWRIVGWTSSPSTTSASTHPRRCLQTGACCSIQPPPAFQHGVYTPMDDAGRWFGLRSCYGGAGGRPPHHGQTPAEAASTKVYTNKLIFIKILGLRQPFFFY